MDIVVRVSIKVPLGVKNVLLTLAILAVLIVLVALVVLVIPVGLVIMLLVKILVTLGGFLDKSTTTIT